MIPADVAPAAWADGINLTLLRCQAYAHAEEAHALATGQIFALAIEFQRCTCAAMAEAVFMRHVENLAAIRARKPVEYGALDKAASDMLAFLVGNAPAVAAVSGFDAAQTEALQIAAREAFTERLAHLVRFTHEDPCS